MTTLADFDERRLQFLFDPPVYLQAATTVEHGGVRVMESSLERVRAQVEDGEIYEASIWIEGDNLRWTCACDAWSEEKACVHAAAAAIATWRDLPREAGGRDDVLKGETQEEAESLR